MSNFKIILVILVCLFFQQKKIIAQNVNIPDSNFKNILVNHNPVIDTNGDGEIQVSEANSYSSYILNNGQPLPENEKITDLTGIEEFVNITQLRVRNHNITSIDISNNPLVEVLYCENNQINNITIGSNSVLTSITCFLNNLSSIDVTQNPALLTLNLSDNNIMGSLNVTQNPDLRQLYIVNNQITDVDVSNNPLLKWFYCDDNNISNINVSNNINLDGLTATNNNSLTEIDIRNGTNSDIILFDVTNNSNLKCVFVDDASAPYLTTTWSVDPTTNFVETEIECSTLSIDESIIGQVKFYPNPVYDKFYIDSKEDLKSISIYDINGKILKVINNYKKLREINISNLSTGIYFIKIKKANAEHNLRIIKK